MRQFDWRLAAVASGLVLGLAACGNPEPSQPAEPQTPADEPAPIEEPVQPEPQEPEFVAIDLLPLAEWRGEAQAQDGAFGVVLTDGDAESYLDRNQFLSGETETYLVSLDLAWNEPTAYGLLRFRFLQEGEWQRADVLINPFQGQITSFSDQVLVAEQQASETGVSVALDVAVPTGTETVSFVILPAVGEAGESYAASAAAVGSLEISNLVIAAR